MPKARPILTELRRPWKFAGAWRGVAVFDNGREYDFVVAPLRVTMFARGVGYTTRRVNAPWLEQAVRLGVQDHEQRAKP